LTAQHVSRDLIDQHQELLNCNYSFWFYSRLSLPAAVVAEFLPWLLNMFQEILSINIRSF